jgi:predicted nuclease of predicted toxin-antitoxin system
MKFLIDMNLSLLWVPFLASHGYEAIHWSTIGDISAPDAEILQYAVGVATLSSRTTLISERSWQQASSGGRA